MSKGKKRLLIVAAVIAVLAVLAAVGYLTMFYHADVLKIDDGKIVGVKPTWLIGRFAVGQEQEQYYKVADVYAPRNYVTDKAAVPSSDDPFITEFNYCGKDPEKDPARYQIRALGGTPAELIGDGAVSGDNGACWKISEENEFSLLYAMPSPYEDASILITVTTDEISDPEALLSLADTMSAKVTPGKQLSPFVADFKLNFIDDDRWQYLWNGLGVTLEITFFAVLIGILLGAIVASIRSTWDNNNESMRKPGGKLVLRIINGICKAYLTVIRGTPVVIQLMIMYYVIFASSRNGVLIGILAFGINSGAYVAEIIRGGIESIDKGQFEAGRSLGFNYLQTMIWIIIPQVFKNVLPALANEFIVLLKETSVAGYVAVMDLTKGGDVIRGVTYSAFLPLLAVAAIYLVLVMFFTRLVGKLERRLRSSDH